MTIEKIAKFFLGLCLDGLEELAVIFITLIGIIYIIGLIVYNTYL